MSTVDGAAASRGRTPCILPVITLAVALAACSDAGGADEQPDPGPDSVESPPTDNGSTGAPDSESGDVGAGGRCAEQDAASILGAWGPDEWIATDVQGSERWRTSVPDRPWNVEINLSNLPSAVVVSYDGTVQMRDADDGQLLATAPGDRFAVTPECGVVVWSEQEGNPETDPAPVVTRIGPDGETSWTLNGLRAFVVGPVGEAVFIRSTDRAQSGGVVVDAQTGTTLWSVPEFDRTDGAGSVVVGRAGACLSYFDYGTGEPLWDGCPPGELELIGDTAILKDEASFSIVDARSGAELMTREGRIAQITPAGAVLYEDIRGNWGYIADVHSGTDTWTKAARRARAMCDNLILLEGMGLSTSAPTQSPMEIAAFEPASGDLLWQMPGIGDQAEIVILADSVVITDHDSDETLIASVDDGSELARFPGVRLFPYPYSDCRLDPDSEFQPTLDFVDSDRPLFTWISGTQLDAYRLETGGQVWSVDLSESD